MSVTEKVPFNFEVHRREHDASFSDSLRAATRIVAAYNSKLTGFQADYYCDGTNDEVEINAALVDCLTTYPYGRVLLLDGTFNIGANVTWTESSGNRDVGVSLEGQGDSTLLVATAAVDVIVLPVSSQPIIRNLAIDGANLGTVGISNGGNNQMRLENVWVHRMASHGVLSNGNDNVIRNVYVDLCAGQGIRVGGGDRGLIEGCTVYSCTQQGIYSDGTVGVGWNLTGNTCWSNSSHGIEWNTATYGVNISDNRLNANTGNGLLLVANTGQCNVHDNYVWDNTQDGIKFSSCVDSVLQDNVVWHNGTQTNDTYANILLTGAGSQYCTVKGNLCRYGGAGNKPKYGLRIDAGVTGTYVQTNDLYHAGVTADYSDAGTSTQLGPNRTTAGWIGSSPGFFTVQEADVTVDATVTTLDFGSGFDVTSSPAGEANVALDASEVSDTPTTQAFGDAAVIGAAATFANSLHKHAMPTAALTTSGLTMATARLLGRTTAGTGAVEELTAGTGLSLAAGSLAHAQVASGDLHTEYLQESLGTALGDILYWSGSAVPAKLAGNITTTKKYLSQTGDGAASAAPAWAQVAFTDLSGVATRAQLPTEIAYEDEANLFSQNQTVEKTYPQFKVRSTGGTAYGRWASAVGNVFNLSANASYDGTWLRDDTTKAAWQFQLDVRSPNFFNLSYAAAGVGVITFIDYMSVNAAGQVAFPVVGSSAGVLIGGDTQWYRDAADKMRTPDTVFIDSSLIVGTAALATTATDGFLRIPSSAGAPTGTPTAYTGRVPLHWDSVNRRFNVYDGSWADVGMSWDAVRTRQVIGSGERITIVGPGDRQDTLGIGTTKTLGTPILGTPTVPRTGFIVPAGHYVRGADRMTLGQNIRGTLEGSGRMEIETLAPVSLALLNRANTFTALLTLSGNDERLRLAGANPYITFYNESGTRQGYIQQNTAPGSLDIVNEQSQAIKLSSGSAVKFSVDATGVGFYAVTPVARPAAYTQTYATATRTHSNPVAASPGSYVAGAAGYTTGAAASALWTSVVNLVTDMANVKQVLNQVIDDLQANGLLQ